MSSRYFKNQFIQSHEKDIKQVFAKITFGASGAPTVSAKDSKGIASVTRVSAGLYDIIFGTPASTQAATADIYYKLLDTNFSFQNATAPAAPALYIVSNTVNTAGKLRVQFNAAGTATDPASGEVCYMNFTFGDSNT